MKKGTVWMVGASSGLGLATAQAFAGDGWLVVAGARSFGESKQGMDGLRPGEKVHLLPLDVTKEESCKQFVEKALEISDRVDVLCYAAGLLVLGSCEETTEDEYEKVMQTNFLGMTRMVSLALPFMRGQGQGKIVLFSSLNGLLGIPFQSAYTAAKHAMEGYAQCLSMEVRPFGIQVSVVEPGDHKGGSSRCRLRAGGIEAESPYEREYESACQIIHRDESNGLAPQNLGKKVLRNVNRSKMRYYLRVAGIDQRAAVWLQRLLPPAFFSALLRGYYVKKGGRSHV